ncbi:hypothetical protein GGP41_003097 [Bipolaris sorokiniana]|uniref:Uncharacterized protein n=1 Tax=Cochliobolus sativus TaxID=45130 RepID=A0A8H6DRL1_COCSA|nr:hypothetical protein GGP41_003097 [Bipolaris sorokiniana]
MCSSYQRLLMQAWALSGCTGGGRLKRYQGTAAGEEGVIEGAAWHPDPASNSINVGATRWEDLSAILHTTRPLEQAMSAAGGSRRLGVIMVLVKPTVMAQEMLASG